MQVKQKGIEMDPDFHLKIGAMLFLENKQMGFLREPKWYGFSIEGFQNKWHRMQWKGQRFQCITAAAI